MQVLLKPLTIGNVSLENNVILAIIFGVPAIIIIIGIVVWIVRQRKGTKGQKTKKEKKDKNKEKK